MQTNEPYLIECIRVLQNRRKSNLMANSGLQVWTSHRPGGCAKQKTQPLFFF